MTFLCQPWGRSPLSAKKQPTQLLTHMLCCTHKDLCDLFNETPLLFSLEMLLKTFKNHFALEAFRIASYILPDNLKEGWDDKAKVSKERFWGEQKCLKSFTTGSNMISNFQNLSLRACRKTATIASGQKPKRWINMFLLSLRFSWVWSSRQSFHFASTQLSHSQGITLLLFWRWGRKTSWMVM